jgi:hypothetical protein
LWEKEFVIKIKREKTRREKFVFFFCMPFIIIIFYLLALSIFIYSLLSVYNTVVYYLFIRGFLIVKQWVQRLNIDFMIFLLLWIKCHSIFLSFMKFVFWAKVLLNFWIGIPFAGNLNFPLFWMYNAMETKELAELL